MASTLYVAVYTAAATATWARADLGNGRNGWSASGYVGSVVDGTIRTDDGDETGTVSGLSAGTSYKLWAIVDDGANSSNGGAAQASVSFTTGVPALVLAPDGTLRHTASASGSDAKLYLTTAGAIHAKTAPGSGDRRISLSGGHWLAS